MAAREIKGFAELPAGSVIHLDYTCDNSANHVFNPHSPPEKALEYFEKALELNPFNQAVRSNINILERQ